MYTETVSASSKLHHSTACSDLESLIHSHTARITIIGQGYVGLPLAVGFAHESFKVVGLDINPERVAMLNQCLSNTPDVLDEELQLLHDDHLYEASTDYSLLSRSDVIIICVPTPLRKTKDPDISYIMEAAERVKEHLRQGQLIILESTTYPGTTEEILLEMFQETGYVAGKDYFLAFSPERIDPGNTNFQVKDIPKITGGVTPECTRLAAILYRQIVDKVVEVSSPKVAELAKLYENVFRSVNIALANEFSMMCRQLDVNTREVINAAATKPFGFMPFYPGPGIGGHCIPVDPSYLTWKMRLNNYQTRFIPLAEEINQSMPELVIDLVNETLNEQGQCINGAAIFVLGVAYKPGVGDTRESPALVIMEKLNKKGALLTYADPYVPSIIIGQETMLTEPVNKKTLKAADCVLILTDHGVFDYPMIVEQARAIVDTRDATWNIEASRSTIKRL